jgi:hypothetical protein
MSENDEAKAVISVKVLMTDEVIPPQKERFRG